MKINYQKEVKEIETERAGKLLEQTEKERERDKEIE